MAQGAAVMSIEPKTQVEAFSVSVSLGHRASADLLARVAVAVVTAAHDAGHPDAEARVTWRQGAAIVLVDGLAAVKGMNVTAALIRRAAETCLREKPDTVG